MNTVHRGDLVAVEVDQIDGQRILASTKFWDGVDELSVENSNVIPSKEPWQAKITSESFGRAAATPYTGSSKDGIRAGDEFKLRLTTLVDGKPTSQNTPDGVHQLVAQEGTLGDLVTATVYQIHNNTAYLALKKVHEKGLSVGQQVPVEVHRLEDTGFLDLHGYDCVPIILEQSVVIGGNARVELTSVHGSLAGKIVGLDFTPKVGDCYEMKVSRGSSTATTNWAEIRGVGSVELVNEATASDTAVVRLIEVGETFRGEIVEYCNPPKLGEELRASVLEQQSTADTHSPAYELELDKPAAFADEVTVEIVGEGTIEGDFVPPRARILTYDKLPVKGAVVNANVAPDGQTATTYGDEHEITLTSHPDGSGLAKVKITHADGAEVRGHVREFPLAEDSLEETERSGNPFSSTSSTNNSDITRKKL